MVDQQGYKKEAIDKIIDFCNSEQLLAKICIPTGFGKIYILAEAIKRLVNEKEKIAVAYITDRRELCEQFRDILVQLKCDSFIVNNIDASDNHKILINTYQKLKNDMVDLRDLNLVICDESYRVNEFQEQVLSSFENAKILGVINNPEWAGNAFDKAPCIFSYTIDQVIKNGDTPIIYREFLILDFLQQLLQKIGYENIQSESKILSEEKVAYIDMVAKKNKKEVFFEVKSYRGRQNTKAVINSAIKQILSYKTLLPKYNSEDIKFVLVMPCEIDEITQKEIFDRFNVIIWNINNLVYLCGDNKELIAKLNQCVPFSITDLVPLEPMGEEHIEDSYIQVGKEDLAINELIESLRQCEYGRKNKSDSKYEAICSNIIKYLFETEFYRSSTQHKTDDEMFRMDFICSLKGTTEFWKFLIDFYRTKFVVFEFKNYADCISQNLIYITEKYLFSVALRNVAFIVSRKGFDKNAKKAAIGCLRENGKLIVDINDDDLINMLLLKKDGNEPSDYLLDKVEELLLSVSK